MSDNKVEATYHPKPEPVKLNETVVRMGINELKMHVYRCASDHGWWEDGERNFGELLALVHSEVSEALEAWREGDNPQEIRYEYDTSNAGKQVLYAPQFVYEGDKVELGKPVGVASELADVIIRILDLSAHLSIPVVEALIRKHNYNLTRPYRHGGKKA